MRKDSLHGISTKDGKWIHYNISRIKELRGLPERALTWSTRPNIHAAMAMLCVLSDQGAVFYELLKQKQIFNRELYRT